MTLSSLLAELSSRSLHLVIKEDRLVVRGEGNKEDLLPDLRDHKPALLRLFRPRGTRWGDDLLKAPPEAQERWWEKTLAFEAQDYPPRLAEYLAWEERDR